MVCAAVDLHIRITEAVTGVDPEKKKTPKRGAFFQ
jgi:hypothetical protein